MTSTTTPITLDVPVFAGQGTSAANSPATRQQALRDASSPVGSLLLSACFEAFHSEVSSLSAEELLQAGIDLSDFKNKNALLDLPADRYLTNPIITGTTLFLLQSLRYVAFVEANGAANHSLTPFSDVLKDNLQYNMGILGFSSGILPACVVGTALNTVTYITQSVEAYKLAIWIGIRTQIYRAAVLTSNPELPWSLVFLGLDKKSAEEAVNTFNKDSESPSLFVTAVTDEKCVTVSGRPDVLAAFSRTAPAGTVVHKTSVDTLYHSSTHEEGVLQEVLADVQRRSIRFPNYADIKVPIRSTFNGDVLSKETASGTLLEAVSKMVLTQPVNWDVVVDKLVQSAPADSSVRLLNVGPGTGLTRSLERAFPQGSASTHDLTPSATTTEAEKEAKSKESAIAIVGMGVHMPGARNPSELWKVLEDGINTISEIPEHRFKVSDYNNPSDPKSGRQMKAHTGNFIDGVDEFDNKFFKISPREAKSMDPQQRILLQTAYEALENSGYVPDATPSFQTDTFGCYVGVATHDYLQNLRNDIDVYYSTGTLKAFLSGRISYAMQLSGPSIVVDTACSSSAVAIYQGCRALINGDCSAALVGGVNVIASPDMALGLDRGHFLSPTGQCKAFDASADGYSRSEGCGVFVIKRLADAIAENDNILGVIRGIEANQSGLAHSITHPHAPTQATLFKRVLDRTGIDANRVSVVEAHGTGTQAGDPNELESIRSIFALQRAPSNPLHITSIKANIGHLEAASGAAGLAKLLLMLRHRSIPRVISLKNLNPKIVPLESDNTMIDTVQVPWPAVEGKSRIALLNNFGAAGSNTATLLEEFVSSSTAPKPEGMSFPFGLSAKTETALEQLRSKYVAWLKGPDSSAHIADLAYTMTARRQIFNYRLAVHASSKEELIEKLEKASTMQLNDDIAKVVFVFSGQGSQYLGMGKTLYATSTTFKSIIDECHTTLVNSGFPGIRQIILADSDGSGMQPLEEFEAYQAAIFSLEYALAQVWISWGLTPSAVVGHSLGEYAALVVANVLSLHDALMIVAQRVRFMVKKCDVETTGMIAVNLGAGALDEVLQSSAAFSGLSISCYNSATDSVVSGPLEQLKGLKAHLDAEVHCKNVLLSVPFGYHSSAMKPLLDDLTLAATMISIRPPTIPVVSNVIGDVVMPGDGSVFKPDYFARHCAQPVEFDRGICALVAKPAFAKIDAWIEIGPHTASLPMLKANAKLPRDTLLLPSLKKQQESWSTLASSLSQLYLTNVNLQWRKVFSHVSVSCVDLPSYPFERTKYWVPFKESSGASQPQAVVQAAPQPTNLIAEYKMLHAWAQQPSARNGNVAIFETPISQLAGSIRGHAVGGMPLCPASVYIEQVLAGIELSKRHLGLNANKSHPVLRKIQFAKPLVYDETVARTVITNISLNDGCGVFSVSSRVGTSEESVHMHGEYRFQSVEETTTKFSRVLPVVTRQVAAVIAGESPEVFSTRTAYEVIFPRVVDYAKEYHTMQSLTVDASGMEGVADVRLPRDHDKGSYVAHPVFMDTLLHVAGFVANMQGGANDAYICSEVGTVKAVPELIDNNASYTVYCNNAWLADEGIMLTEAYAVQVAEPRRIVAHLKGMCFRRVRLNSLKKGLAMAAGKTAAPRAPSLPAPQRNPISIKSASKPASATIPSATATSNVSAEVIRIVSETCDISASSVNVKTDLASLGVDSLMSIEIFGKLQAAFPGANLDPRTLSHCESITDIVQEVSKTVSTTGGTDQSTAISSYQVPAPAEVVENISSASDVQTEVINIVADTCGISAASLSVDADLDSLGVDSLMSIEIFSKLQETFSDASLDANALSSCRSVADIVKKIPSTTTSRSAPLPSYQSGPSSPMTLVVHEEKLLEPSPLSIDGPDVKQLLASVLDITTKDISDDADFETLGLDSLTSIEALGALKSEFGLELPGDFFSDYKTAREVQSYLSKRLRV
ncbi:polyketide synthase [Crucibulum laeve]|uniref:Polyketide synthase n=1 Tax=Crucibulum laeve TaxID=68775 RepID=A0A5C3ME36_9AGAR|nr:polyketide synthase [Crucibulum laeve]